MRKIKRLYSSGKQPCVSLSVALFLALTSLCIYYSLEQFRVRSSATGVLTALMLFTESLGLLVASCAAVQFVSVRRKSGKEALIFFRGCLVGLLPLPAMYLSAFMDGSFLGWAMRTFYHFFSFPGRTLLDFLPLGSSEGLAGASIMFEAKYYLLLFGFNVPLWIALLFLLSFLFRRI